jgi:hypothetical protein
MKDLGMANVAKDLVLSRCAGFLRPLAFAIREMALEIRAGHFHSSAQCSRAKKEV